MDRRASSLAFQSKPHKSPHETMIQASAAGYMQSTGSTVNALSGKISTSWGSGELRGWEPGEECGQMEWLERRGRLQEYDGD
mmetsp:Transcript_6344/g.7292  ORF Transcript_6344/g.7292 Transcript_6344/m.7292 type:complete len:82 (+) Transcript_6344:180-425(+)